MANLAPYLSSIRLMVIIFPFLAVLLLVPLLVRQYHRYGAISGWMMTINYAFVFYMMCAYALTILPLPTIEQVRRMTGPVENWQLFSFVKDFMTYSGFVLSQPSTWLEAAKSPQFIQPFFNLLLLFPFGMFLHYHYKKRFLISFILSFGVSLSFELIQRSALFGIYPRPYRLFDVDDLLLNTCGAMFGWLISIPLGKMLPKKENIVQMLERKSDKVSVSRKSVAAVIDVMLILLSCAGYYLVFKHSKLSVLILLGIFYLFWIVLPECLKWSTLGQKLVHLKLVDHSGQKVSFFAVIMRNILGYVLVSILFGFELYFLNQTGVVPDSELGTYYFFIVLGFFFIILYLMSLVVSVFTKKYYYEVLSGTRLVSTYHEKK